jgi:hypothetical protein
MLALLPSPALASDFVDTWVTTALEEDNVAAGPSDGSPAPNFVSRGNQTFFENYDSRYTDDISQTHLVLYRKDEGFSPGVFTEAAFVLRMAPYLDPSNSKPGVEVGDDGSYLRIGRELGQDRVLSVTGYAVDANRFRLGYSYDLTWGGRDIYAFDPYAAPGLRVQYQAGESYAFLGAKTAVGDYQPTGNDEEGSNLQAYWGTLAGGGIELGRHVRAEVGAGWFQQGQLTNVPDSASPLYNAPIVAMGGSAQVSARTNPDLEYVVSNELRLYRNAPDFVRDTYISHRQLDGSGFLVQAEANFLAHNLLDATKSDQTTVERALAGDVQGTFVTGSTELNLDVVYKDLAFIVFDIPGITSGYALSPKMDVTPELYVRGRISRYFPKAHIAPSLGVGWMKPVTYSAGGFTYVQYDERNKAHVPDGQTPTAILSSVAGVQVDVSKSTVLVGEVLYTLDNNQSQFVQTEDLSGTYEPEDTWIRNAIGFNLMMRARF